MKIYILFEFKENLSGGGSQFLKAIRNVFIDKNVYTDNIEDADCVLYNSHQYVDQLLMFKLTYKNILFIHRIDGPMRLYNTFDDKRDLIVNITNKYIADATIFQSNWSKKENLNMGIENNTFETIITNAPDLNIFNRKNKIKFNKNRKIKLIATSWSTNPKKGFDIYKWLDENLDFSKFEFTYIGNSTIVFKNIIHKTAMNSKDLAIELKKNDIFITASQKDPCSNSLIEALHCGLPAVGLADGGHPEIIAKAGETFNKKEELPALFDKIILNYEEYQRNINLLDINTIGEQYFKFLESIYFEKKKNKYEPKIFNKVTFFKLKLMLFIWKIQELISVRVKIQLKNK